jgi:hypothetical protein
MERPMELDELKSAWQALDRRMQKESALNLHIFVERKLDKVSARLRRFYWVKIVQILFGDALIYFGIVCAMRYVTVPHLFVCSVFMLLYGALVVVLGGVTLGRISRIDYAAPVVDIQKRVNALHRAHILANLCAGVPWWFLWIAIFTLEVKGNLGVDLFVTAPAFIRVSVAIGAAGLFITLWLYRRARDARHQHTASMLDKAGTPRSLRDAKKALDEIARFEDV